MKIYTIMNIKNWFINAYTISLVAAAGIVLLLILGVKSWLNDYTLHGQEFDLPSYRGLKVEEAQADLKSKGLVGVVFDSIYTSAVDPGCIIETSPVSGCKVKPGRTIYFHVRPRNPRMVSLPDYNSVQLRQYINSLEGKGLKLKDIKFVTYEHKDLVLGVELDGKPVVKNQKIKEGSAVVLKVGRGKEMEDVEMPVLVGMNFEQAKYKIFDVQRTYTVTYEGGKHDPSVADRDYIVYAQSPEAHVKLNGEFRINISVKKRK